MQKEIFTLTYQIYSGYTSGDINLFESEKETYSKDEVIKMKNKELTDEDKEDMLSKNTCGYLYFRRNLKIIEEMEDNYDFSNFKKKIDISNKNLCFDYYQFPELKDLVDCGYANINIITEDNKYYNFKTCFYIPNDKMPEEFKSYFRAVFLQPILEESIPEIVSGMEASDWYKNYGKLV